ncbi:MAG: PTS ascorbate transporter subunit IIC [Lachnospiraceae bacterium]|nr:PTS ascorbate transporter subunit IIC [Lachnospiraceae bacterium]
MTFLGFFLELLETPAIVLALVSLIGLIVQKRGTSYVISGTVKTALGYLVLSAGSGLIVTEILPFVGLFQTVFGLDGFATGSEVIVGAMSEAVPAIASTSAVIMGGGFLVNILLARFTPLKYIFLTGHMMWISSIAVAYSLYTAGLSNGMIIAIGVVIQGVFLTLIPAISQPIVRCVTGTDDFAIGHLTTLGTVSAGYIGGLLGNKEKNAEDMQLPKKLAFFKDSAMSISAVMVVFYLIVVIAAGPEEVAAYAGATNYIIYGLLKGLGFTAGILVLLQGVRMLLGELVPAFKGIADKIVPNAIPALDVPVLFTYAPNSLMLGFIFAVAGMLAAMLVSSAVLGVVPLVSIIGAFFTGGVAGVFGNAKGGRRGAMIAGFVYGFELIFLSGLTYQIFGHFAAVGAEGTGHDCIDAMMLMLAMKNVWIGIAVIIAVFVLLSVLKMKKGKTAA